MGTADYCWSLIALGVQQPTPPDVISAWINRNLTLDPNALVVYSCGRGTGAALEPRVDPFGVEQLYPNDPGLGLNSAAIACMTVSVGICAGAALMASAVNGSHAWPLTGSDPTGRGLVTRDVDWARRLLAFWNTYAAMGPANAPAWTRC